MNWNTQKQYENPPVGNHVARCCSIVDLGSQPHLNKKTGEEWMQRDVMLVWELPHEQMSDGKPFTARTTLKQSLHEASKLRGLLESWRGKKFDADSLSAFDPKKLLGTTCRITLVEAGQYVNVASVSPLGKGDKCPDAINKPLFFSLDESEFSPSVLAELSEKLQEKIKASPEYKQLMQESGAEPEQDGGPF